MPELLFGPMPHDEAIDFIKSKPVVSRQVFDGLLPELKARAFTVTGIEGANVLQAVRDRIADLPAGHLWDDVKRDIADDISPFLVDPNATGDERAAQEIAAERRAELLLRTHGFQAYQAAQFQVMERQRDVLPFWQYLTMEDERVRPEHAALDQIVMPVDSPFWSNHFPPWDWGCRCQVVPISQEDRDDLAAADTKRAPDDQLVLQGPLATHLEQGTLVRPGRTFDVRAPRDKEGGSGFTWDPASLRLPLEQLKARYDAPVWAEFEAWARRTPLDSGPGRAGTAKTVWEWLGGKPAAPAPPVAIATPSVAETIEQLKKMHAAHEAIGAEFAPAFATYQATVATLKLTVHDQLLFQQERDRLGAELQALLNDIQSRKELLLAQERDLVRQPASQQSKLPFLNHSGTGLIKHLQEGLEFWRKYAAAAIDLTDSKDIMGVFALGAGDRAYCDFQGIHVTPSTSASVIMHEVAHWIDRCHKKLAQANIDFLMRRTVGEKAQKLSKLTGNKGYGSGEVAKPDKFHHPYVGKIYAPPASEIMSMGIERLHQNPGLFAAQDDDYLEHVLKTLRGETNQ